MARVTMAPTGATTSETAGLLGCQSRGFLVAVGVSVALAACFLSYAPRGADRSGIGLSGRLNPNTAPVASLARLPGVGPTRAAAIVAYRAQIRAERGDEIAFRCAEDLRPIRGIGPKTVQAIAPWLDFGVSPHSAGE